MSLYLSRLCLNPLFGRSLQLAADPYLLHQKLLPTLSCDTREKPNVARQPKTADLLFRVDETEHGPAVLLQTAEAPDWQALELAPRALRRPAETKPYTPEFGLGQRLSFRLLCRPSVRCSRPFSWWSPGMRPENRREVKRGQRYGIRGDQELIDWLKDQGKGYSERPGLNGFAGHGFIIETVGLTRVEWVNSKPNGKSGNRENQERLGAVRFDGILLVTDSDKLREAVRNGIGPQKAFGFGLLSVAPVR
jgi:CRISPR system Cascade subunit CasE